MLDQFVVGCVLVAATSIVQDDFMLSGFGALQALRTHERRFARHNAAMIITVFVLYMFLAMIVQVGMWAAVYVWVGAIDVFIDALYISTATFTKIGFGDVTVAPEWRLLVGFEGANRIIICGWATALIMAAIQHFDVW
ncbi:MAG: ion channel, partial [Burkholderiales bacterium]